MSTFTLRPRWRDLALTAALIATAVALAAVLAARTPLGIDYVGAPQTYCDCAGTPVRALAHGDFHAFFASQPVMGSASLLLRAPFAAVGLHLGASSDLDLYRLGAFPCLLAAGLLGVCLFGRMRELRRPLVSCLLLAGLVAINPLTTRALRYGHPEDILAAVLCVAAVLAAARRRPLAAGVLIGAAFATKQWALLAAPPVLLAAAAEDRMRLALGGIGAAALLTVPLAAGNLHRLVEANHQAGVIAGSAMPTNVWFPFGTDVAVVLGPHGATTPPRVIPAAMAAVSHPLILVAGLALALAWWRLRRDAHPEDTLLLIALIMLMRCLLDPLTNSYYHLPFLVSLAAWEGLRRRGAPVLTVSAVLLIAFTSALGSAGVNLIALNRFYLLWTVPFALLLATLAFRPATARAPLPSAA